MKKLTFDDELYAQLSGAENLGGQGSVSPDESSEGITSSGADDSDFEDMLSAPIDDEDPTDSDDSDGDEPMGLGGASGVAACTAGSLRCGGAEVAAENIQQTYVCSVAATDASWAASGGVCPYVCDDGNCTGVCDPSASRCLSDVSVEVCDALGEWQEQDCGAQACVSESCQGVCRPSSTRCDGTDIQRCDEAGVWQDYQSCGSAACENALCVGDCVNGATQCQINSEGSQILLTCANNSWGEAEQETCDFVCGPATSSGEASYACVGECVPDERECTGAGSGTRRCSTEGLWLEGTTCSEGCQQGECNTCQPQARRCVGNVSQVCRSDGTWNAGSPCSGEVCAAGYCEKCTPGQQRCAGDTIESCEGSPGDYGWEEEQNCDLIKAGPDGEFATCGILGNDFQCVFQQCDFFVSVQYQGGLPVDQHNCSSDARRCNAKTGVCVGNKMVCPGASEGCLSETLGWRCSALSEGSTGTFQNTTCDCSEGGLPLECDGMMGF